ncbi:MAG: hypothetical protein E6J34_17890 [Chloroflexi bacterium]|nr:MAG: hypothetical protein E6J34_17890 [Chloroflexota bacterium]
MFALVLMEKRRAPVARRVPPLPPMASRASIRETNAAERGQLSSNVSPLLICPASEWCLRCTTNESE